jgi:hypothetical protein
MIESNWLARAAGGLLLAVPLTAFSAPPPSAPDHTHPLQNTIFASNCIDEPGVTTCETISTYSSYDIFYKTFSNTSFDVSEFRILSDGYTVRSMSCSMAVTTLKVDKKGATLAATLLDPTSPDCFTFGYSLINGVYDDSFGGFPGVLVVSGAFSSPVIETSGSRNDVLVDNSTGARFKSTCALGSGENMLQGGFFINGAFFAAYGGPNAISRTSYAKCVNLGKF